MKIVRNHELGRDAVRHWVDESVEQLLEVDVRFPLVARVFEAQAFREVVAYLDANFQVR